MKLDITPIFEWTKDGYTTCIIKSANSSREFIGEARCHPDDADMMSQKTGYEIAFQRAKIQAIRAYRDELKAQLRALNQLYYSMNKSKRFNEKSYENRMLQRQIRMTNFDLATIREDLATEEQNLRTYIEEKEKFYKRIRHNRKIDIIPVEDKTN